MESTAQSTDTGTNEGTEGVESEGSEGQPDPNAQATSGAPKANGQGGTVSPAEQTVRKIKYKANGKDVEVDEPELIRRAQKAEGVEKTIRETAELKKQTAEFIKRLKADPFSVLADENVGLGKEMRKKVEEWLVGQLEHDAKDPKEKALEEYKAQAEGYKKRLEEFERATHEAKLKQLTDASRQELEKQITDALDGSILPKSERTVGRIAYYLAEGRKRGLQLQVKQVIPLVEEDFQNETRALAGGMAPEKLIQFLGEETINKIAEYRVASRKNPSQTSAGSPPVSKPRTPTKQDPSFDDFFSRLGR